MLQSPRLPTRACGSSSRHRHRPSARARGPRSPQGGPRTLCPHGSPSTLLPRSWGPQCRYQPAPVTQETWEKIAVWFLSSKIRWEKCCQLFSMVEMVAEQRGLVGVILLIMAGQETYKSIPSALLLFILEFLLYYTSAMSVSG